MAPSPRSTPTSGARSPPSLASSFSFIARPAAAMHAADDAEHTSSDESFASFSGDSSEDDEIVWSVSDLSASVLSSQHGLRSPELFSDDDFIVLGQPQPATRAVSARASGAPSVSSIDGLSDVFTTLVVDSEDSDEDSVYPVSQPSSTPLRRSRRIAAQKRDAAVATGVATVAPPTPTPPAQSPPATPKRKKSKAKVVNPPSTTESKKARKKAARKAKKAAQAAAAPAPKPESGFGTRPIVDDASEAGDVKSGSLYDDAVQYVSSFLSSPSDETRKKTNLTLLQALIVELGLCSTTTPEPSSDSEQSFYHLPSLPRTIRAAKALLKSSVFLNVRDYLEQRNKGLDALRSVMHPSRKSLVKDLHRRRVPREFVKNTGLGVLLVTCYS